MPKLTITRLVDKTSPIGELKPGQLLQGCQTGHIGMKLEDRRLPPFYQNGEWSCYVALETGNSYICANTAVVVVLEQVGEWQVRPAT